MQDKNHYNPDHYQQSLVEPGHFGKSQDNIIIIENFIEKQNIKKIQDFVQTINKWVDPGQDVYKDDGTVLFNASYWKDRQCSGEIIKELDIEIFYLIEYYIDKLKDILEKIFNVKLYSRPPHIVRWFEGLYQEPHADKQLNDGSPNPFPNYDINSLIYINEDFEGGELYYPQHNFQIKPKPGLAVAHPGDIHYMHGVRKVTSGERWTMPSFYTITEVL